MNQIDLEGRHAIVTGGASGIGLATAERFLKSGASVAIWDQSAELLDQAGAHLRAFGTVRAVPVDIGSFAAVEQALALSESGIGPIDILVNSAGITRQPAPITDYPLRDWRDVLSVNLDGVFFCCRAVIPGMVARGYGRVVNIASMAGKEGNAHETAYSTAKAGVIALTKSLGKELGRTGVIVNALAPGVLSTSMRTSRASPELVAQLMQRTPLGRPGDVAELAATIAWMASAECSYTTGFTFDASGGRATY